MPEVIRTILQDFARYDPKMFARSVSALRVAVEEMAVEFCPDGAEILIAESYEPSGPCRKCGSPAGGETPTRQPEHLLTGRYGLKYCALCGTQWEGQTCGNCKWSTFQMTKHNPPRPMLDRYGTCEWPMPTLPKLALSVTSRHYFNWITQRSVIWPTDENCPTWEAK